MSLNKCMIIGNLGRDPEMRYTPSGQAVTQFTVATNRNYRDAQGEWQSETEWFRVVAWAQLAERVAENLRKGMKVYVEGRLQTRQWEKEGQKHYTTEVKADKFVLLGGGGGGSRGGDRQVERGGDSGYQDPMRDPAPVTDDDIPF